MKTKADKAVLCSVCGDEVDEDELFEFENEIFCQDCYDEKISCCDNCGDVYTTDDLHIIDDEYICQDCLDENYSTCDCCCETIHNDSCISVGNCDIYCEECYNENYTTCENCETEIRRDDSYYHEGTDETLCEDCYSNMTSNSLHNYSYKPQPDFHKTSTESTPLYLGIELEVESNGHDFEDFVENLPSCFYAKEDSSIDNGLEIVSHPMSYNYMKQHAQLWNDILSLRKEGFRSYDTNTCGMHIHLSKNYFTTLHLLKLLTFFYNNPSFILTISQRRKCNLDHWASVNDQDGESLCYKAKHKTGGKRYTAINLLNPHTIEIRIFRGNLSPSGFWKNIEFAQAIVDYTKNESMKQVSLDGFTGFVIANKRTYANLYNFLRKKGVICA